jgi:adenosylcobinamide-GDP ribazoletransferase
MKPFLAALQFLTVIPIRAPLEERDFERSPAWFPFVGLIIGGLCMLGDFVSWKLGVTGLLRDLLVIGLLSALSGGLHLDGLADTADGFLSARPRERVLEIMRDSRIGTMGVLALVFVLAIKVAALEGLAGSARWKTLLFAPMAGRAMQIAAMRFLPYARGAAGGLATIFVRRNSWPRAVWVSGCWLAAACSLFGLRMGLLLAVSVMVAAVGASIWSARRIGGFTGDTLGATSELVETAALLAIHCCQ